MNCLQHHHHSSADSKWINVKFCQHDSEKLQWQSTSFLNTVTLPSANKANIPALVVFLDSSNSSENSTFHIQSTPKDCNLSLTHDNGHTGSDQRSMQSTVLYPASHLLLVIGRVGKKKSMYIAILSQDTLLPL